MLGNINNYRKHNIVKFNPHCLSTPLKDANQIVRFRLN
jgi:hypothetical protein